MRSGAAVGLGLALLATTTFAAPPEYSCFDPPDEGQTNGLGLGFEDIVEQECCSAYVDESDTAVDRQVVWDPINCNHGPGEVPISEAFQCRAHGVDGCRFCYYTCVDVVGPCLDCDEIYTASPTSSPFTFPPMTPAPTPDGLWPVTPVPTATPVPVATTLVPVAATDPPTANVTPSPTDGVVGVGEEDCGACFLMSEGDAAVLLARGKTMTCDLTCTTGDDTWGVLNCNYFSLGQNCRACSESCSQPINPDGSTTGTWVDPFGILCKPCEAI